MDGLRLGCHSRGLSVGHPRRPALSRAPSRRIVTFLHDPYDLFGPSDAKKLGSCLTLFLRAAPDEPAFAQALARYFAGTLDEATERLLLP